MVWVKIDDSILDNPKIIRSGPVGFALHTAAITWCARNLTDGFVPEAKAKQLLSKTWNDPVREDGKELIWELNAGSGHCGMSADEVIESVVRLLVHVGLWHEGVDDYGNHGYWLNDFTEFNPTRAEVLEKREVRSAAGKVGGQQTQAKRQANSKQTRSKAPSKNQPPYPVPGPVPDPQKTEEDPPTPLREELVAVASSPVAVAPPGDLQARAARVVANPTLADYETPQAWPEVLEPIRVLHRSLGLGTPKPGAYSRDSGVRAVIGLYADGRTEAELISACEAAVADEYCKKHRLRGAAVLTPAVVMALLSGASTSEGADALLRAADGERSYVGRRRGPPEAIGASLGRLVPRAAGGENG